MLDGDGSAVLDAPVKAQGSKASGTRRVPGSPPAPRREMADDYARRSRVAIAASRSGEGAEDHARTQYAPRRFNGLRFRLKGGVPRSWTGRLLASGLVLASLAGISAVLWEARALLLHDPRLVLASSSAVRITGNQHVTRAQLLSIFGGDVERNLLTVPMNERRTQLEALPWVEHATVMRLLPNHVRVAIVERTPVAFVRQGSHIGLVDANGVLLDMSPDASVDDHYSFPVVTGLNAEDPLSTRAARMQLYAKFTKDLDSDGAAISKSLSEVDLTSPEDVKAMVPAGDSAILVHFGQDDFLSRYKKFEANLPEWRTEYPRLTSVDMRYERQVVLEMAKGNALSQQGSEVAAGSPGSPAADKVTEVEHAATGKPANRAKLTAAKKPKGKGRVATKAVVKKEVRPLTSTTVKTLPPARANKGAAATAQPAWEQRLNGSHPQHLERSFAVGGAAHSSTQGPK